jgi:ABC-2 type transport system ATP-binding protein
VDTIVEVESLRRAFGARLALDDVSFRVAAGECFAMLGPNGGGKTTLFRILTTMLTPTSGRALIAGADVQSESAAVRRAIGVVFQSPGLDPYLTVGENMHHGGRLYGLGGPSLAARIDEMLAGLGVADRARDLVKTLSGGLRRRVELAKCLLHRPSLLILDEPSTGLDPAARREFWNLLQRVRAESGVTILLTTHFMEEADRCDRVGILDRGRLVACDAPAALKCRIGGDCVTVWCDEPDAMRRRLSAELNCQASVVDGVVRIDSDVAGDLAARILATFGREVRAVTIGRPTLEDVFMNETGRRFDAGEGKPEAA